MAVLDIQIAQSSDDAQESAGTVVINGTTNGNDLDATTDWVGLRFIVPSIASGDTINVAYLTVQPTASASDEPDVTIFCEAADNPSTFSTAASNISGRSRTTASVNWASTDLGANGSTDFNTASLVSPVQEVINRAGWAAGNALVFLIQGSATATRDLSVKLFDGAGGAATAPRLHIEYTAAAGATGQPMFARHGRFVLPKLGRGF